MNTQKYAGLVDNPMLLPTLIGVLKLYSSLNTNLSHQVLKQYSYLFSAAEDSVMKYDEGFKLKVEGNVEVVVVSVLRLALLNLKRFSKIMDEFEEISGAGYAIYNELTKRRRFAYSNPNVNHIPSLEQALKRMTNLYDLVSDDKMYSDASLRQLKTNCTKLVNYLDPEIEVAGENLSYFFEDSAKVVGALNVALNSIDRKEPGLFMVSYQAMEMLDDLKSKIFM